MGLLSGLGHSSSKYFLKIIWVVIKILYFNSLGWNFVKFLAFNYGDVVW